MSWLDLVEPRAAAVRMPELVTLPGPGPVLLVAPHPDDEVLGAGGTLRKYVEAGETVNVVFVTDGRRGGHDRGRPDVLAAVRQREAEASCASLGVTGVDFLNAPDGTFKVDQQLVDALAAVLSRSRPRLLFVPGFEERHREHLLTAALAAEMWRQVCGDWMICAYEVWTPLAPDCVVNITRQFEHKCAALRCHASRLERIDYLAFMEGLARYRSALVPLPNVRFAEAFRRSSAEAFTNALIDSLPIKDRALGEPLSERISP